jgi:hypothetical protein
MYDFCTIMSPDYLPFVMVLYQSLQEQNRQIRLHVLVTAGGKPDDTETITFYSPKDIAAVKFADLIFNKYESEPDKLRWALKPVFISFILSKVLLVIYVDNDIYFYSDFTFIFDRLRQHSVLLSPNHKEWLPYEKRSNFSTNFTHGIFNAGFIGATRKSIALMRWWAEVCFYHMKKDPDHGFFNDQRYLELMLVMDEQVGVLQHPGCNVAAWNIHQSKRSLKNGQVLINGSLPVVFIHYSWETILHIVNGNDYLLQPFYEKYEAAFRQLGFNLKALKTDIAKIKQPGAARRLQLRLRPRTRLRQWLQQLYQKL